MNSCFSKILLFLYNLLDGKQFECALYCNSIDNLYFLSQGHILTIHLLHLDTERLVATETSLNENILSKKS